MLLPGIRPLTLSDPDGDLVLQVFEFIFIVTRRPGLWARFSPLAYRHLLRQRRGQSRGRLRYEPVQLCATAVTWLQSSDDTIGMIADR